MASLLTFIPRALSKKCKGRREWLARRGGRAQDDIQAVLIVSIQPPSPSGGGGRAGGIRDSCILRIRNLGQQICL